MIMNRTLSTVLFLGAISVAYPDVRTYAETYIPSSTQATADLSVQEVTGLTATGLASNICNLTSTRAGSSPVQCVGTNKITVTNTSPNNLVVMMSANNDETRCAENYQFQKLSGYGFKPTTTYDVVGVLANARDNTYILGTPSCRDPDSYEATHSLYFKLTPSGSIIFTPYIYAKPTGAGTKTSSYTFQTRHP